MARESRRSCRTGRATWDEGLLLFLERSGFPEETYHTFSYSPVFDDLGRVGGMLCVVTEETERVLGERRLATLGSLAASTRGLRTAEEVCDRAARTLANDLNDVPFALVYLLDEGRRARLAGRAGLEPDAAIASPRFDPTLPGAPWPLPSIGPAPEPTVVDLREHPESVHAGPWPEALTHAAVLPLPVSGTDRLAGLLVLGLSTRALWNAGYRGFLSLAAGQVASAVADARAFEAERRRLEELAELDRAKTTFFNNISHEFRTPLTLLLGPVEESLVSGVPPSGESIDLVHRNALRLQRLVNSLLEFSRLEAGRADATFRPTDLARLTADLASSFRSAFDRAGLRFEVDAPPLAEPVHVDRDMWERVVLNLLSNALKFTLAGSVQVQPRTGRRRGPPPGPGHRHRHSRRRAASPLPALPPRAGRARPDPRGLGDRPCPGERHRAAARRTDLGREPLGGGQRLRGPDPPRPCPSAGGAGARRGRRFAAPCRPGLRGGSPSLVPLGRAVPGSRWPRPVRARDAS